MKTTDPTTPASQILALLSKSKQPAAAIIALLLWLVGWNLADGTRAKVERLEHDVGEMRLEVHELKRDLAQLADVAGDAFDTELAAGR